MAGAVVAGPAAGGYADFAQAADAMTGVQTRAYEPDPQARATYDVLYGFYRRLYDAFGAGDYAANLGEVMKGLLAVRDRVRG
jgi:L-ribulokinase